MTAIAMSRRQAMLGAATMAGAATLSGLPLPARARAPFAKDQAPLLLSFRARQDAGNCHFGRHSAAR